MPRVWGDFSEKSGCALQGGSMAVRAEMDPRIEYRQCPRLPSDRFLFGEDGSAWHRLSKQAPWRRLRPHLNTRGGQPIITAVIEGKRRNLALGPLILSAFGDPKPLGHVLLYKDGNKLNNRRSNLRWAPRGSTPPCLASRRRGSFHQNSKLTESDVINARRMYLAGSSAQDISEEFAINRITATMMLTGRTWSHVPGAVKMRSAGTTGSSHAKAKLDEIDVLEIRSELQSGKKAGLIARERAVSKSTIEHIQYGRTWRHVV
jgi:hypothetical protein